MGQPAFVICNVWVPDVPAASPQAAILLVTWTVAARVFGSHVKWFRNVNLKWPRRDGLKWHRRGLLGGRLGRGRVGRRRCRFR